MRLLLFMLLTALVTCSSPVDADSWVKDPTTGCKLWGGDTGEDVSNDIVSWSGGCEGGYASGTGVLSWFSEGSLYGRYEGAMKKGKMEGLGTLFIKPEEGDGYDHYQAELVGGEI